MNFVVEALGVKSGGGVELTLNLLEHFRRHTNHHFVALLPDVPEYTGVAGGACRVRRFPKDAGLASRHFLLNRTVPQICREESADALLCLGNFAPRNSACPTLVLLQNAWNVYREKTAESRLTLRERLVVEYGRWFYRKLPGRTRVIVQTEVMKNRLCSTSGTDPNQVDVIHSAFRMPENEGLRASPAAERSGNRGVFTFLCLGRYYAHKNIEILLDAIEKLPRYTESHARCLITLSRDQHPRARRLLKRLKNSNIGGAVQNIGPVPRAGLSRVYAMADAYLLPTLLETVGFTYVEAMNSGLPILTSDRDFARNQCRNAAIYFDPLDANNIARAMAQVMEDAELRRRLIENGRHLLRRAPRWENVAAQFVSALEQAAGSEKRAARAEYAFTF